MILSCLLSELTFLPATVNLSKVGGHAFSPTMETPQVQVGAREVSQRPSDATPNTNSADVEMTIAQNPTTETQGETAPNINLTDAPPAEPVANPTEAPAVSQKKPGYHFLE